MKTFLILSALALAMAVPAHAQQKPYDDSSYGPRDCYSGKMKQGAYDNYTYSDQPTYDKSYFDSGWKTTPPKQKWGGFDYSESYVIYPKR